MQYALFRQSGALARRYGAVLLGDPPRVLLLFCQAAVFAGMLLLLQQYSRTPSNALLLWLPVAAFWCGGFAACQEIVRERAIFRREQMIGVTISAYLLSKYRLLSIVAFLQTALLILVFLSAKFPFPDHRFFWWLFAYLFALVGVAFGLLVSAAAPNRLAALITIGSFAVAHFAFFYYAIMPGTPWRALKYTPVAIGYTISRALMAVEPEMLSLFTGIGVLCLWSGIFGILAMLLLRRADS